MTWSETPPVDALPERGASRLGMVHIEPFNGCHEMRLNDEDAAVNGSHRVIVTARFATDSVWSKTVVISNVRP